MERMGEVLLRGFWGGKRDLNPQRPEPQSGALPIELFPPQISDYSNLVAAKAEISSSDGMQ
jgi:hypothetical protein